MDIKITGSCSIIIYNIDGLLLIGFVMDLVFFLILLSVFIAIYSVLGWYASKDVKNISDYFLAGRNLGVLSVTSGLLATQIGGGTLLGTASLAYDSGFFGLVYSLGMVTGLFILSTGVAARLRSFNIATTAELFEVGYGSLVLKKWASFLSIITLSGILVSQIVASKALLAGIGINYESVFLIFWFFIIAHTVIGGLETVIIVETYQVFFIFLTFLGIFLYCMGLELSALGFPALKQINIISVLMNVQKTTFVNEAISFPYYISAFIITACFVLIEQDIAQRFFAARTRLVATVSALCAGILLILFSCIPIYFGMKARLLGLPITPDINPLMPVISILTNDFVVMLATCGVIAAISSTADSLLCAISSNLAQDFDMSWIGIQKGLLQSKIITLCIGITLLTSSYLVPYTIIEIIIKSYALSVSCLFVPLVYAYYSDILKKQAAYGAVIAGFIGFMSIPLIAYTYPGWFVLLPKDLVPVFVSCIGFLIGHMFC